MKESTNNEILMKLTFKKLLFIQVLSMLSTLIGPLIDGIIVSDFLGSEYMAAFGICSPVVILVSAVANIFNAGSQNVVGKYLGQGKTDKLNSLLTYTIFSAGITGVIFSILLIAFSRPVLVLLGARGAIIDMSMDYVNAYALSIVPTLMLPSLVGFLQLDNGGKTVVKASAVLALSDVILDFLAVLVFKNGMVGIGLATTISYFLSVLVIFTHFFNKKASLKFTLKGFLAEDIKKVIFCGLPAATFLICNAIRISATNNIILEVSDYISVAAFSIQNTFRPVTIGFTLGTGITSLLVCSVILGEENRHAIRKELSYILKIGTIMSVILMSVVIIFAKYPFAFMFCIGQSNEFMELVTMVIRLFAISIPFSMLNIIFIYYYQSMRWLVLSTIVSALQNVVFYLIVVKVLSMFFGVNGIWLGYIFAEFFTLLVIFIFTWIKNKYFPKNTHDFLLLPDSFGVSPENRMNVTVVSMDEAIKISEKISDFCKNKNIDKLRSMCASLCTEELAVIAMKNCDYEKPYVDIYVTFKNGELNIRMRDNSHPFDKKLLAGVVDENDICANVGIRIVKGLAKDITYNVVLGMNTYSMVI